MAGSIQVKSIEQEGSEFIVKLPVDFPENQAQEEGLPQPGSTARPSVDKRPFIPAVNSGEEISIKTEKILLVEDNLINQRVAVAILKKLGYSADVAQNGIEAIDALHTNRYDLVFMDMQMPVMDGLEATKIIRQSSSVLDREVPIIAMTANATEDDRDKCAKTGMNDFISKPVTMEVLINILESWLPKNGRDNASG
jgi:CheY-like chemotaxis protein